MNKNLNFAAIIKKLNDTGLFHIFGASVINKIMNFLCSIVVVRIVSKAAFGEYTYANNTVSLVLLLSGLGLASGTFQLCSEEINNRKKQIDIYNYGCSLGIKFNLLLSIIIILASVVGNLKIKESEDLLLLMAFYPVIYVVFEFQQNYLRSTLNNKKYSLGTTINTVLVVIFSICGALLYQIKGLIFGTYVAYILTIIIVFCAFKAPVKLIKQKLDKSTKITLIKLSLISMCNNGLSQLLYLADTFLLGLILADENIIASYKVATVIPNAMTFIPLSVITYVYPYFAMNRTDKVWTKKKYKLLLKVMLVGNLFISGILFIFAEQIISLVYGVNYLDAVPCFKILAISYFFSGSFRIVSGNLLVTQRKVGFNLFVAIISGLLNILGNIVFIPLYGSVGAAMVTLMIVIFTSLVSTLYYTHVIKK